MTLTKQSTSSKITITVRRSTYEVFLKLKDLGLTESEMHSLTKKVKSITAPTP